MALNPSGSLLMVVPKDLHPTQMGTDRDAVFRFIICVYLRHLWIKHVQPFSGFLISDNVF